MAVPRADAKMWERVKDLEDGLRRLRADLVGGGVDPDDRILDPLGNVVVEVDLTAGQGLLRPRLSATITAPSAATTVTSATYVEAFTVAGRWQNAAWEIRFTASCDAGTTGSVRAVIAGAATELHAPVGIADGDTITPAWSLNLPGVWDDYVIVEIQAERLTGSGNVRVRPYSAAGG